MKDLRPTSETIQNRGTRNLCLPVLVGAAVFGTLLLPVPSSWAETLIEIRLEPDTASEAATARLTAPNGAVQEARDDDGDGILVFVAREAGEHDLAIERGTTGERRALPVPEKGRVAVVYDPAAPAERRWQIEVREEPTFESEIVVTARRREESLDRVPIAVTAFSDVALEVRSMRNLTDVGDFTPNLDFSVSGGAGGSPSEATVYLRGVGQIEPGIFADPGVGIYVDGVYIARSQGAVFDLLDLDRVEVLRGPQGTLFGKNTTGGAIQLITRAPSPDLEGRFGVIAGNLDRRDLQLRVSGGLSDSLSGSLSVLSTARDGYARSLQTGPTFNDDNRESARLALRYRPGDRWIFDLSLDGTRERETALDQSLLAIFGAPLFEFYQQVLAADGQPIITDEFITGDLRLSNSSFPSRNDGDIFSSTLRASYQGDGFELLSISNVRDVEYLGSSDFDGSPIGFFARTYDQEQSQRSQEIQLSGSARGDRLQWLAGGLYFEENPVDDSLTLNLEGLFEGLERAPGPIFAPPGAPPSLCNPVPVEGALCFGGAGNPLNFAFFFGDGIRDRLDIETTSWALFGEATLAAGERFSLTGGLRYTREEKDVEFFTEPQNSPPRTLLENEDWEAWSPRVSLAYRPGEDTMLYLAISRGFKGGGFNASRSLSRTELVPFDQETVWATEAGLKTELLDNRLRLNAAAFYYDYEDIQFASFLVIDGELFLVIQNAAQGRIQGVELELEAHPAPGLTLAATLAYLDTEYTDLVAEGGASLDGQIPKSPEWSHTLSLQYAFELEDRGSLILRGDYSYKDDYFNDVANSSFIAQEGFGLLNARVIYATPSDRWEFALSGTNLGDEEYLEHGFAALSAGLATGIAGRPREWALSVQYQF